MVSEREVFMKKRGMLTMVLASAMAVSTLAAVPAAARTVAAAPAAVHQAVPPTADLKLLRHRRK